MNDHLSPEALYRQGLHHFSRREWQAAIDAFSELRASATEWPGVEQLLLDARLKLHLEGVEPPTPMPPPRPRRAVWVLLVLLICLLPIASYEAYALTRTAPAPVAAVARALPTDVPPTATQAPVVLLEPTPPPIPTPTDVPVLKSTVVVTPADGSTLISTPKNIEIIVDASGSMLAEVDETGKQRWQVAQEALMSLISSGAISDKSYVALRTYGRNRGGDCGDLELAQELKRFRGDALAGVVVGIKPAIGGMTPLAASLRAATQDLQAAEGRTVVILLTDGLESCNGDPVADAANFIAGGQRNVHVIGFALGDPEASDKLRQIATSGNGLYFDAANSAELAAALRQTFVLSYQILAQDDTEIAAGTIGEGAPIELQPGSYKLKINANPPIEKSFVVDSGDHIRVDIRQGYGGLVAELRPGTP